MIKELEIDNTITISEGERHNTILSIANSILRRHHKSNISVEELKNFFEEINEQLCRPSPLSQKEIDVIWESAIQFLEENKKLNKLVQLKKKAVLIGEACEKIMSINHFLTIEESKEILYYQDGVYIKGGETLIEKELEKYYDYQLSTCNINEIKGHIMRKTYTKSRI
jgi:putative DNA primase/helicase